MRDNVARDPKTGECTTCSKGMGISGPIRQCVTCQFDECIGTDGKCRAVNNEIADPVTKMCKCKDKYGIKNDQCVKCEDGIDPETLKCKTCAQNQCIDPDTRFCREFENEGFNIETKECVRCPPDATIDPNNHQCICPEGRGFNSLTGRCYLCADGEGIDPITRECVICPIGQTILDSKECGYCPDGQGIDSTTGKCITCPSGQGILPYNNQCGTCKADSTFNEESKKCICNNGFVSINDGSCKKCPENSVIIENNCVCKKGFIMVDDLCQECPKGQTSSSDGTKCIECPYYQCIDSDTMECKGMSGTDGKHPITNKCITCPEGSQQNNRYYCECEDSSKGLNSELTQCITCSDGNGINSFGLCEKCDIEECIDDNGKCVSMKSGSSYLYFKDKDTGQCLTECNDNYHPLGRRCGVCPDNSINGNDNQCLCPNNEAIVETEAFKCGICPDFYGIDSNTNMCVKCRDTQCISSDGECVSNDSNHLTYSKDGKCVTECPTGSFPIGFLCIKCPENECYDYISKTCRAPVNDEYINSDNNQCLCNAGLGYNKTDTIHYCTKCSTGDCINQYGICESPGIYKSIEKDTGKCLNDCSKGVNPITKICDDCYEGSSPNTNYPNYYKPCRCTDPKNGYIFDENKCGTCLFGQCISSSTNVCIEPGQGTGIDSDSNLCISCTKDFKGINPISKICSYCNSDECIDSTTRECIKVPENYGISTEDGTCILCLYPFVKDQLTNKCICPSGQGFDGKTCTVCEYGISSSNECTFCYTNKEGIDHESRLCRKCNDNEGIDPFTYECTTCPQGMTVDFDTFFCACTNKQGLNPDTKQCGPCKKNEGINSDGICQKCPYGKGIDPETLKCIECPKKYGIDEDTGMCRLCPEKQGINKYSKICQVCKENEGINRITGECMKCLSDQFIDDDNKCTCSDNNKYVDYSYKCSNCPSDQVLNDDKTGCFYCHDRNLGLDTENMVCVPCTKGQGINYSTKKCEENDDENQCILYYNMRWVSVSSDDLIRNKDTSFCECKTKGHGFISGECFNCGDGYGIDPITYQCRACESNKGEGKDKETGKCRICENTEAISPITGECIDKPEGASKDGYFWSCPKNQYFDSDNSRCSDCSDGQYVDSYTLQCTSCSEESKMVDPTTNKCVCKEKYGRYYDDCVKCIDQNNK